MDGRETEYTARLIVGADGKLSMTRRWTGGESVAGFSVRTSPNVPNALPRPSSRTRGLSVSVSSAPAYLVAPDAFDAILSQERGWCTGEQWVSPNEPHLSGHAPSGRLGWPPLSRNHALRPASRPDWSRMAAAWRGTASRSPRGRREPVSRVLPRRQRSRRSPVARAGPRGPGGGQWVRPSPHVRSARAPRCPRR